MIHAELHGKLAASIPEPARLEDALTSSIIGTLALVEAWDVLADWFALAVGPDEEKKGDHHVGDERELWFWPRLAEAEPDVLVRIGNRLWIVEAKHRSSLHGKVLTNPSDDDWDSTGFHTTSTPDQLVREWRSCDPVLSSGHVYPCGIRQAVNECRRTLVLIVARRHRAARWRDLVASGEALGIDADLRLLTWEDLHDLLDGRSGVRWVRDVLAYLSHLGMASFTGTTRPMVEAHRQRGAIGRLRKKVSPFHVALGSVIASAIALDRYLVSRRAASGTLGFTGFQHAIVEVHQSSHSLVRRWRTRKRISVRTSALDLIPVLPLLHILAATGDQDE